MAKARRSNNPLPNWREKIAPQDQERWLPEEQSDTPQPLMPSKRHEVGEELNQGINRAFMLQCRARNEARRLYGNGAVNKRFVDAYAAQLLRKWL